ncbi:MAG: hypothetical protein JNL01_01265 [Bdellovibrionales bacterium]|nr:hypothetical protein [Bdellovibrionales bacterium]
MRYDLQFQNLAYDPELEKRTNLRLVEILAIAPPEAIAKAQIRKEGRTFVASTTVESGFRTFQQSALGPSAREAIMNALRRLEEQVYRWRYGRGPGSTSLQPGLRKPAAVSA